MRRLACLTFLLAAMACGRGPKTRSLPDIKLTTYGGRASSSLASCPAAKCLTVVVAPWCGYCRAGTPAMLRLRSWLSPRGVQTRFIVGMADLESVKDYAREFGPEALLDPSRLLKVSGGVPHFFVSDAKGDVLKEVSGMPMVEDPADFAGFLGLP